MEATLKPRLRLLEARAVTNGGREGVWLSDPEGLFAGPLWVPGWAWPIIARFTGAKTIAEISAELSRVAAFQISVTDVANIASELEEHLCLEGDRVEAVRSERLAEWTALAARPATHAGSAGYPLEPEACRARLDEMLCGEPVSEKGTLVALVAPHIDLERGERGYAAAYRALLRAQPADLYVVFGTGHQCPATPLVPTRKHYDTPVGVAETDAGFVDDVCTELGELCPFTQERLHLREHSVEFQALFLKHCLGDRPFKIAPFLTGQLPERPGNSAVVQRILDGFGAALAKRPELRVCFVAGADMAHIGPWFGDSEPVAGAQLAELEQRDRASLDLLAAGSFEEFYADIESNGNPRRVCGTVPIYLAARLGARLVTDLSVQVLAYGQAVAPDASQVVSFGSVSFGG